MAGSVVLVPNNQSVPLPVNIKKGSTIINTGSVPVSLSASHVLDPTDTYVLQPNGSASWSGSTCFAQAANGTLYVVDGIVPFLPVAGPSLTATSVQLVRSDGRNYPINSNSFANFTAGNSAFTIANPTGSSRVMIASLAITQAVSTTSEANFQGIIDGVGVFLLITCGDIAQQYPSGLLLDPGTAFTANTTATGAFFQATYDIVT